MTGNPQAFSCDRESAQLQGEDGFRVTGEFVLLSMLFIVFFQPAEYALPHVVYLAWRAAAVVVSIGSIGAYLLSCKVTLRWILIVLSCFGMMIWSSWVNDADAGAIWTVSQFLRISGFISLIEWALWKNARTALTAFAFSGTLMLLLHFISFLAYSDEFGGMRGVFLQTELGRSAARDGNWYLLTYDNDSFFYFLPVAVALWELGLKFSRRAYLPLAFLILAGIYMYVSKLAVTAAIAMMLFLVLSVVGLLLTRGSLRLFRYEFVISIGIGLLFCVSVVGLVVSGAISDVAAAVGKSATFSGREGIWRYSLDLIAQKPLFGWGIESAELSALKIGHTHCHNIVLQLCYSGGLASLMLFVGGVFECRPCFDLKRASLADRMVIAVASAGIIAFFVAAGMDWLYRNPLPLFVFFSVSPIVAAVDERRTIAQSSARKKKGER